MFFPLRSNLPTTPLTAAHHTSRLALTLVASLLLAACGSSTPAPATPTPTPLLAPDLSVVNPQPYTQDTAITPLVFGNTGGDVTDDATGCAVDTSDSKPALPTGLMVEVVTDSGKRTCRITGMPTEVVSPARVVTITATNTTESDTATVSIIVNPATPNLQELGAQSYPTGAPVNVKLDNRGGGELTECTVNNTLPNGLSVARNTGNDSCEITGTPDTVTLAADYDITATNDGGSDTATVSIAVPSGVASFETATPGALVYAVGDIVSEIFTNTNADGSRVSACVAPTDRTLPDELSIDAIASPGNGCVLTGTPITITAQASYTITVTNDNGDASLTLDITVNPAAPDLSSVNAQVYTPNTDITPLVFANTGGDVTNDATGCTAGISGDNRLPAGLMVGRANSGDTCQITGMPMEAVSPARMVTITATNVTGSDTVTVPITVSSGIVPDSLSGQNLFRYEAGRTVSDPRQITFTSTITGVDIPSCIAPDLPDGMSIDSMNCTISGKPSRTTAETTTHIITATYADMTTSKATIFIETYLSGPPSLSNYSGVTLADGTLAGVTLVVGSTVGLPIVLENTGGLVGKNGCQITSDNTGGEQPLSSLGLELAVTDGNSSCEIRAIGTAPAAPAAPTAAAEKTRYDITATNDLGISGTVVATLRIIEASETLAAPTLTAPTPSSFTFALHTAITPIVFTIRGGGLGICTISPALPAGLRFDPSTCQISGTPRVGLTETSYTITATNSTSPPATATVAITVTDAAPALESMVALNLTMNSNAGLPFAIANTGGSPTTCTAAPTTASDDALDSYNLTTFDASGTCVIDSLDGNGPSRTLDGGSFTITPSSGAATTLTLNLRTPITPQISAGSDRTYAINSARQLFGWGDNDTNRLGLGDPGNLPDSIFTPRLLTANDWEQVDSGADHTCAIKASGQLFCWGHNISGQLGLGNNNSASTPTQVGGANDWMQVSAGGRHTCAINTSGELFCWGDGNAGRLGLGNNNGTNTPTQVGGANDWMQVSAGGRHTCAINTFGELFCWGEGDSGRLGLGNNPSTNTPMRVGGVGGASDWMQVSAGAALHTCAIKTSGQLWCWGFGRDGKLGLGNNPSTNTPMRVGGAGGASDWMKVSAGGSYTCAIKTSGQLFCWGFNGNGQLGLGNNNGTNTPTQVGGDEDWMQVSGSRDHTCAIKASGQLWCWGLGASGQLGLGSDTNMNTPTLVTVNPATTSLGAPDLSDASAQTYTQNTAITDLVFTNTGGDVNAIDGCAVDTSGGNRLPTGLNVEVVTDNNGKRTCQIIGTPTEVVSTARTVTITATNTTGPASATVSITVNPATPNLQELGAQSYPTGAPVNVKLDNRGGGELTECTVNNTLPNGLRVARNTGNDSCEITGTPDTVTPAADYDITATNDGGSDTATVSIAVPSGVASFETATPGALVYAVDDIVSESFANTNTVGSRVSACVVPTDETLPDGLSIDAIASPGNGCVLTGTPTTITGEADYTVTVTNISGNASLTLGITVNPAAPNLSSVNAQVYTPNTDITPLVFDNAGGDVTASTGCAVDNSNDKPNLPTGLSVGVVTDNGKRTCRITGMPMEVVSPARIVTITATNITRSASVTVPIIVSSGIVPGSLSGQSLFRYEAGRTVTRQITFTSLGDPITSCTVPNMIDGMPNGLPDEMNISPTTCIISGTPSRITAETTTHTITAMHMSGATSTATISIETYLSAPPSLSDYSGVTLVMGSAVGLPIVLENTGGPVGENGCQVTSDNTGGEQPLNSLGLALAVTDGNSSCEIRAIDTDPADPIPPTATIAETGYRINATNDLGVSGVAVATFTIIGTDTALPAPTLTAPAGSPFMFATNTAITPIDFAPSGKLGICTISPALPAGLRFDPSTCQISGTPRMALTMTSYTITATNNTSPAATATVVITVTNTAAPSLEQMVTLNLTMNSNVGLPFAIANTGGSPTTCTAAPTTAGDDDLDSYNLTTFDAGGTCVIDSLDGNGPSRTLDGGSFTITPSTGTASTLTLNLRTPITPQIVAGDNRTYAINSAGQLFGWGDNKENRLGLGDLDDSLNPIPAPALFTANDWKQVSSGITHTCAIKESGELFCWGLGNSGQLGLGNNDGDGDGFIDNTNTPTRVDDASDWMQVDSGGDHTCAIKAAGQLWCWGSGNSGQLGLGNTSSTNTPTRVGDASDWMQVDSGSSHICAIKAAGQLWCWGAGDSGRLGLGNNDGDGDGFIDNTNTPMRVGDASDWMQVDSGGDHTCAIKALGQLWCWGFGSSGQLGLGDKNNRNTPTQVGMARNWMQVSTGSSHTCAINTSGQLWCWGYGETGQLGLGTNDRTNDTPMQVGGTDGPSDWMRVSAGVGYTCAIKTSGQLWCWGFGESGQLGLDSDTNMNTPTLVPNFLLQ